MQLSLPSQRPAWSQRLLDRWLGTDWFISYAWTDGQELATELHAALTASGLRVFLDRRELRAGEPIASRLATALRRTRGLIVIGTAAAISNGWVLAETKMAKALALPIVPIDVGGALAADAASTPARLPLDDLLRIAHPGQDAYSGLLDAIDARRLGERAEVLQRRALVATVLTLLVLVALVAVFAFVAKIQRDWARRERDISQANELAVRSQLVQQDDPVTAARLAVAAADRTASHDLVTPAVLQQLRASTLDGTPRSVGDRRIAVAVNLQDHLVAITDTRRILAAGNESPSPWIELGEHLQSANAIATIDATNALSLSIGGELVLIRPADRTVRRVAVLPPRTQHGSTLRTALAVDASRRRIAVGDSEGWLEIYPVDADWMPGPVQSWRGHGGLVTALTFTASGGLVSASLDDRVLQWPLTANPPTAQVLHDHAGGARALALGPGDAIASGGGDGTVILHRAGGKAIVVGRHPVAVSCVHFLGDDLLVSGDARGDLGVWAKLTSDDFRALDRQLLRGGGADAVALQPRGTTSVRMLGDDGAVRDFELAPGSMLREPVRFGTGSDLGTVLVAANGNQLLLASSAQDCEWVDLADPTAMPPLLPKVRALAATTDLSQLVWVSADGTWSHATRTGATLGQARRLGLADGAQPLLAIGDRGRLLAIADDQGMRVVRDAAKAISVPLPAPANWLHALEDRDMLLVGCRDGTLVVLAAGDTQVARKHEANIRDGAVDASGRWLATGDDGGRLLVWDLHAKPPIVARVIVEREEQFYAVACAAERSRFVAAGHRGTLLVVDVDDTGRITTQRVDADTSTVAVAASANGNLVACASFATTPQRVLVFDLRQPEGERVPDIFPAGPDSLTQVAFVPGGKWLLAHDGSGTARLWRLDPGEMVRHARGRLPLTVNASK